MTYKELSTAIVSSDEKVAALWFDWIVPLRPIALADIDVQKSLSLLLPDWFSTQEGLWLYRRAIDYDIMRLDALHRQKNEHLYKEIQADFASSANDSDRYLSGAPQTDMVPFGVMAPDAVSAYDENAISIALHGVKIVDSDKLEWKHILDFRKDKNSIQKLRNLRLFLFENYENKEAEYIKDDLLRKTHEYEQVIRMWGFDTVTKVLQSVFSMKSIPAAEASAMVSAFSGNIPLSLATGTLFEIGQISLSVLERRRELSKIKTSSPISYITNVRELVKRRQ